MSGTSWRKVVFAHHTRSRKRGNRSQRCQGPGPPESADQLANVIVQVGQNLLAVGMTDRDGANACGDHTQSRLVQISRQRFLGLAAGQRPE